MGLFSRKPKLAKFKGKALIAFNSEEERMEAAIDTFLWIKDYRNMYEGKRCFIIATGPSLTVEDLEKLKNEYTFGMNSLCLAGDRTDFVPTFFWSSRPGRVRKDFRYA